MPFGLGLRPARFPASALRRDRFGGSGRALGRASAEQGPGELIPGMEQLIEGGVHVRVPYRQWPCGGIAAVCVSAGALACDIFGGVHGGAA